MLESRNFKDKSVIENLSDAELQCLIDLDEKAKSHGRNTIVSLIHDNFENKGRRLFIAVPTKREGIDKLHYRGYIMDSWDEKPKPSECINSFFATKHDALLMADALHGAEGLVDEAMREYRGRMAIEKNHKENPNQKEVLAPEEITPVKKDSKKEEFTQLDKLITEMSPTVEDTGKEDSAPEMVK